MRMHNPLRSFVGCEYTTTDFLEENGASASSFVRLLRMAIGDSDGIDVRYEK